MISPDSIKNRLSNKANKTGKTMQELLTLYCIERTIFRLSVSEYSNKFTLKGGILLYALFNGNYARATADVDLLAEKMPNDVDNMYHIFQNILAIKTDDPIRYDEKTLKVVPITEQKKYHGLKVSVLAFLDRTQINISIDIGFGDTVYPNKIMMEYPSLLNDDNPNIYAYSIYSCIAEKFEAMVSLGYDNSRLKDFYDIYVIATSFNINGNELLEAIKETFNHRNTKVETIVIFDNDFIDDIMIKRWTSFINKKKATKKISLNDAINLIKSLLMPLVEVMIKNESFSLTWDYSKLIWV